MTTLKEDLKELSSMCWKIESKLPYINGIADNLTDPEYIRRRLYVLRIQIGAIEAETTIRGVEYDQGTVAVS